MRTCRHCGGKLARVRRKLHQKLFFQSIFNCKRCARDETQNRWFLFLFGKESSCPKCGSLRLEKMRGVDHIDRMYKNPLSYLQKFLGASLHWCPLCRLQFYDRRKKVSSREATSLASSAGE
jgi:hypothetical protein